MGDVINREEFETLFLILYKKWKGWDKQTCAYGVGWDIWQYQQEIIDELKAFNPDVLCPVCGETWKRPPDAVGCEFCNTKGTVPLTKAQEYRKKELEAEIKRLDK